MSDDDGSLNLDEKTGSKSLWPLDSAWELLLLREEGNLGERLTFDWRHLTGVIRGVGRVNGTWKKFGLVWGTCVPGEEELPPI